MNLLPKSAWRYVFMMVCLLGVVAWAAFSIISHLDRQLVDPRQAQVMRELSISVWSLTMGVMFLTGAFGLWAIRSTVEIEGRRRIGRFVAAMDYLSDGLVLLEKSGNIAGFNPAFQRLAPRTLSMIDNMSLADVYPGLTASDMACLLDLSRPREVERECHCADGIRRLRFRSQPLSGVRLVLVSDVTDMHSQEMRLRQNALLQLVGRIAGGVAHDFNNILCAVSGHASLLERQGLPAAARAESLAVIQRESQKGALLSRQLLALSRSGMRGRPGARAERHMEEAAALLRVALTPAWNVKLEMAGDCAPVPLTADQIEQIVLNLGLLAADAQPKPGTLTLALMRPGAGKLTNVAKEYAAVLMVSAETDLAAAPAGAVQDDREIEAMTRLGDEGGVILSVVGSIVHEVQGDLECLASASGACVYRVCLPPMVSSPGIAPSAEDLPAEWGDYLAGWRVMLALADDEFNSLDSTLRAAGANTERCGNVMALLGGMDELQRQDALIVDLKLLGNEVEGLLRAILKLCPRTGVVALCAEDMSTMAELKSSVAFAAYNEPVGRIMQLLVIARALRASKSAPPSDGISV